MALEKAKIVNLSLDKERPIEVLFNPTEYSIDRGVSYAELPVPGRQIPILQFVRGEAQTLNVELFLDGTNKREPIEEDLTRLRSLVRIDENLHAPPVCRLEWGKVSGGLQRTGQGRASEEIFFTGVVTSLRERFTLFDESGRVLRARVALSLKSYRAAAVQKRENTLSSPDRSRVRVMREGETLSQIANEVYGDARLWRQIAEANGISSPRFVAPGTPLRVPSLQDSASTASKT